MDDARCETRRVYVCVGAFMLCLGTVCVCTSATGVVSSFILVSLREKTRIPKENSTDSLILHRYFDRRLLRLGMKRNDIPECMLYLR